jgi:AcrR family transcriptional regulator
MTTTRRERIRTDTIAEIKAAALDQIAELGGPALSIRGVARAIGMSPAGLYRYYPGRDALLTDLIADAYNDLAGTVEGAIASSTSREFKTRFVTAVLAYRRWGLDNPNRFLLIFGTPIPGYVAPEGGPTVEANRRMGQAFFGLAAEAWSRGRLEEPTTGRRPTPGEKELAGEIGQMAPGFPPRLISSLLGAWAEWHGLVTLEITRQLDWLYPDTEVFVRERVGRLADRLVAGT